MQSPDSFRSRTCVRTTLLLPDRRPLLNVSWHSSRHRPRKAFHASHVATMAKLSLALAALVASASAFAPQTSGPATSALNGRASPFIFGEADMKDDSIWDPMGLYELGSGEAFDTFPNMFPDKQFLEEAEIKHGRQAMLAWTGIWATHQVSICLLAVPVDLELFCILTLVLLVLSIM